MNDGPERLCVDHSYLKRGAALLVDHDECPVCQALGHTDAQPPPRNTIDPN